MIRQRGQIQGQVPYISTPKMLENAAVPMSGAVKQKRAGDLQQRLLKARLHWCQKNRSQAGALDEKEGWLAEEEGLHDAFVGRERVELIRLCYPAQIERYRLGFHDGQALLCPSLMEMRRLPFSGVAGPGRPQSTVLSEWQKITGSSN